MTDISNITNLPEAHFNRQHEQYKRAEAIDDFELSMELMHKMSKITDQISQSEGVWN